MRPWRRGGNPGYLLLGFLLLLIKHSDESLELRNLLRKKTQEVCELMMFPNLRDIWWFRNVQREANCRPTFYNDNQLFIFDFRLQTGMKLVAEMSGDRKVHHRVNLVNRSPRRGSSRTIDFPYHISLRWDEDAAVFNTRYNTKWERERRVSPIPVLNTYNYTIEIHILEHTFETFADGRLMMSLPRRGPLDIARTISIPWNVAVYRLDVIM